MRPVSRQSARSFLAAILIAAFAVPQELKAQYSPHVVSPSALEKATVDAAQTRQRNLDTLNNFLSTGQAKQAMDSLHTSPQEVKNAVAGLSDEELAQLAVRANKAQSDLAAGNINDRDLLIIVLAVVALILIIVAVR